MLVFCRLGSCAGGSAGYIPGKSFTPNWSSYYGVVFDDDVPVEVPVARKNSRSRGRHEPGDGPLINRWVFDKFSKVTVGSNTYMAAFEDDYVTHGTRTGHWLKGVTKWDGQTYMWAGVAKNYPDNGRYVTNVSITKYRFSHWTSPQYAYFETKSKSWDGGFRGENAEQLAFDFYYEHIKHFDDAFDIFPGGTGYTTPRKYACQLDPSGEPKFSKAPLVWVDELELGIGDFGRGANALLGEAYINMCNNMPDASGMSNAVNAIQLASAGLKAIAGIFTGNAKLTVGSLKDAWLAYRYSYSTTKADLTEAAALLSRAADLAGDSSVRCNGSSSRRLSDDDLVIARCSATFTVPELASLKSTIEKYGLQMDGYAMWDLVPFSFVADWFLDVGGRLEFARGRNFALRSRYKSCWCSIERHWVNEFGYEEIFYYRFQGHPDVLSAGYRSSSPSGVTVVKRALDALCLFT